MPDRAVVVHATDLLACGLQAAPGEESSEAGEPTHALLAAVRAMRRALAFKEPARAVAVIDESAPQPGWPESLRVQHGRLRRVLEAHGVPVVIAGDAVHLVASYAEAAREDGLDVVVVGSDKRLAQLVDASTWWYDAYKDVRYTPQLVRKRFEVAPERVAGWLALVGDDDALPGVKGIGKKGATLLVQAHGSIERAIEHAGDAEGRAGKALRARLDDARRELGRAVLDRARPLPVPWEKLHFAAPATESLNALYRELGFFGLVEAEGAGTDVTVCETREEALAALDGLGDGAQTAVLAVTEDPSAARGELVGLALSRGGDRALYATGAAIEALGPWLADGARHKIGHDTKATAVALARRGLSLAGVTGDTECASHLLDPAGMSPHELPDLARRYLHQPIDDDTEVRGVGRRRKRWRELPAAVVGDHAGHWAAAAVALWDHFEPTVDRALMDEYLALGETLAQMEVRGIACDGQDLARAGGDFARIEAELEAEIYAHAGKEFNIGSTKQLGSVLYEDLGLPIVKRTKMGWSTASDALERIEHAHPIVAGVIRWRRLRWLRGTWTESLRNAIDTDGRVRATMHHARSFSGRIICSHPDLGRVPGRTSEMARIRHAFVAPPGRVLLSVDFVQLGLYVLAHLSGDPALVEPLSQRRDLHRLTAAAVLDRRPEEVTPEQRQLGKVVNFATFAGQGPSALALQLGVSPAEAKKIVARFFDHYRVVRGFQDRQLALARERGFVVTLAGRPWRVAGFESLDPQQSSYAERMGRRATHEGSVADITRRALLDADRALRAAGLGARPVLQVLDEVIFEAPADELADTARVAADAMRGAYHLRVPLRVTAKAGPNWADLAPLDL